jgi:hypothetical protein
VRRLALVTLAFVAALVAPATASADVDPVVGGIRTLGGALQGCRGINAACELETEVGRAFEARIADVPRAGEWWLDVALTYRRPGGAQLLPARTLRLTLGPDGVARTGLPPLLRGRAGLWCLRPSIVDRATNAAFAWGAASCVRLRPPIELGWAGDTVIGSHYGLPPNGGRDQLALVAPLLRAPDLMIGNYEGTLSTGGSPRCGGGGLCYLFQAPPRRARNLRDAGFDVMNLANNHGLDYGEDARRQTVRALRDVGIAAAGLPGAVTVVRVQDTRVAIVGMSPYPGTTSMRQPAAIRALVGEARRRGDVVVMCMHVGLEGPAGAHVPYGADYGTLTRSMSHLAIEAGADVVLGSGPHVVRGVERWRGRYIVYSSGNFAGWHNFGLGGLLSQSGVVRMTFDAHGRPRSAAWDGVVIDGPGVPRPDRSGAVVRRVASLSRDDFGSRGARFTRGGGFR